MERADQVLAERVVDADLAADRAVHLRQQRRRHVHERDAAQEGGRGEAGDVADDAAADGDEGAAAVGAAADERVVDRDTAAGVLYRSPSGMRIGSALAERLRSGAPCSCQTTGSTRRSAAAPSRRRVEQRGSIVATGVPSAPDDRWDRRRRPQRYRQSSRPAGCIAGDVTDSIAVHDAPTSSSSAAAWPGCVPRSRSPTRGEVLVLTKADPGESNTGYAQGGIAAAVGPDDSPELHAADTMRPATASATPTPSTCWSRRVRVTCASCSTGAPRSTARRRRAGAGTEGAHPCAACCTRATPPAARSAACCGRASLASRRASSHARAGHVLPACDGGAGPAPSSSTARRRAMSRATRTLLATGGAGQVFRETTNPAVATGDGMAMAFEPGRGVSRPRVRAVSSHRAERAPARRVSCCPRRCAAKAAGSSTPTGERFMARYDAGGDLAPRDVVARAMVREPSGPARRSTSRWRTSIPTGCASAFRRSPRRAAASASTWPPTAFPSARPRTT